MAGEKIYRYGRAVKSIDWTATANGSKGDLIELPSGYGFLLDDVRRGGRVAVALECDLVTVPQPDTARAWKAGEPVYLDGDDKIDDETNIAKAKLGVVHHDIDATEARVPIVWQPDYGHYFQEITGSTTPAIGIDVSSNQRLDNGLQLYYQDLMSGTTLKGIRPGVPIYVTFSGFLEWRMSKAVVSEILVSYFLFHNSTSRIAVIENTYRRQERSNYRQSIALNDFSFHFNIKPGDALDRGRVGNGRTVVSARDFTDGIPVRLGVRFRALTNGLGVTTDVTNVNPILGNNLKMTTLQRGYPVR